MIVSLNDSPRAVSECELRVNVSERLVAAFNPFSSRGTVGIPSQAGKNSQEVPDFRTFRRGFIKSDR